MRTCIGCRRVAPQRELVRIAFDGAGLAVDHRRRLPGRGAYVHQIEACVVRSGLARTLRRTVSPADVQRIVTELSRPGDKSPGIAAETLDPGENPHDLNPGLATAKPVETSSSE